MGLSVQPSYVCRTRAGRSCLSVARPMNQSMQAKANTFVTRTNTASRDVVMRFAQLNSESVIVHIENLVRHDGSGASGSYQGDP